MMPNAILGYFLFAIESAMFQELQRNTSQRWSAQERVGRRPAYQHLGPGEDEITLPGYILPLFCGQTSMLALDGLRDLQASGEAKQLILLSLQGTVGDLAGQWIITDITENQSEFFGAAPQRIDFTLKLKRVDEKDSLLKTAVSAVKGAAKGVINGLL
jgi:phage protein U